MDQLSYTLCLDRVYMYHTSSRLVRMGPQLHQVAVLAHVNTTEPSAPI